MRWRPWRDWLRRPHVPGVAGPCVDQPVTRVQRAFATAHRAPAVAGGCRVARLAEDLAAELEHRVAAEDDRVGLVLADDLLGLGAREGEHGVGGGDGAGRGEQRILVHVGHDDPWLDAGGLKGRESRGRLRGEDEGDRGAGLGHAPSLSVPPRITPLRFRHVRYLFSPATDAVGNSCLCSAVSPCAGRRDR